MTFEEVVTDWLRSSGRSDVVELVRCRGIGDDWAGSTEGGFEKVFEVEVVWLKPDGTQNTDWIRGGEMESLWMHVVGAWGDRA